MGNDNPLACANFPFLQEAHLYFYDFLGVSVPASLTSPRMLCLLAGPSRREITSKWVCWFEAMSSVPEMLSQEDRKFQASLVYQQVPSQ